MLEQAELNAHREPSPVETVRCAEFRRRICVSLFKTAWIWFLVGWLSFVCMFIPNTRGPARILANVFAWTNLIGIAVFSVALAASFAINRCPACDAYLGWFRKDKFHCPNCDAQVRI